MINVSIEGRHSNRVPINYPPYRHLLSQKIRYIDDPKFSDVIVFGFVVDLIDGFDRYAMLKKQNPDIKFLILSEEPLWDTIWSGDYLSKKSKIVKNDNELEYSIINHFNSDVFDYEKIPYFLTTDDKYFLLYSNFFSRNRKLNSWALMDDLKSRRFSSIFVAERRIDKQFNVYDLNGDVIGLSCYRTYLAEGMKEPKKIIGSGWGDSSVRRQDKFDWHLDKIFHIDRQAKIVSSIENTFNKNYVTEKIFDAYASLSVPVYYSGRSHSVLKLIKNASFIDLYGLDFNESIALIEGFEITSEFAEAYLSDTNFLNSIFINPKYLIDERLSFSSRFYESICGCC